jgi:hypothetical protein
MPVIPIGHDFGAEVIGLDLRTPLDAEAAAAIDAAIDRYAVGVPRTWLGSDTRPSVSIGAKFSPIISGISRCSI